MQPHADELQEPQVVPVGDPVQAVEELVDHEGERLDERDAGVGDVVVGPLRAPLLHQAFGVVDEVLEAAVVEVGGGQPAIDAILRRDQVEGEHEVARVVGAPLDVADVDVEGGGVAGVEGDVDVGDLDPGLPPVERGPHLVGDAAGGGGVGRGEHEVVDGAAELRAHRPLARGGAEHEGDGLLQLPVTATTGRSSRWRRCAAGRRPAGADERFTHRARPDPHGGRRARQGAGQPKHRVQVEPWRPPAGPRPARRHPCRS